MVELPNAEWRLWIDELKIIFGNCPELPELLGLLYGHLDFKRIGNANCIFKLITFFDLEAKWLATLVEEAREQFAKGASIWSRLEGVEVIGMVVYKGHNSAAYQAAGWFRGSTFVRDLINTHKLQLAKYKEIDSCATVPIPDWNPDANVDDDGLNTDEELEYAKAGSFHDWNCHIVPVMIFKKLEYRQVHILKSWGFGFPEYSKGELEWRQME
ncbi:hypothetical protein BS17DRAFT_766588 [Gyrodon lividus]|nr:hypothetical protein BS17DRAFT_766588 [Gyrodon lividus]